MIEIPKINIQNATIAKMPAPGTPLAPAALTLVKNESTIKEENFIMSFGHNFIVVLAVLLIVSIVLLLLGYYFSILNFDKKIGNLETTYTTKQQLNNRLADWEKTIIALEAEKPKFDQMVPEKKELSKVLVQLELLAQKHNLVFNSIENKTDSFGSLPSETKEFQNQSYEVTLSGGDYFTLKQYLVNIESSLRVVAPRSLIYSPDVNMFVLTFDIYHR